MSEALFQRVAFIGFGLIGLQAGTNIFTHIDIGNINGNNLVRSLSLESEIQYCS